MMTSKIVLAVTWVLSVWASAQTVPRIEDPIADWLLFAFYVFVASAIAGLSVLLWEDKRSSLRRLSGGIGLSGFAGAITSLFLWEYLKDKPTMVAAIALVAGLGGATTIDLFGESFRTLAKVALENLGGIVKKFFSVFGSTKKED